MENLESEKQKDKQNSAKQGYDPNAITSRNTLYPQHITQEKNNSRTNLPVDITQRIAKNDVMASINNQLASQAKIQESQPTKKAEQSNMALGQSIEDQSIIGQSESSHNIPNLQKQPISLTTFNTSQSSLHLQSISQPPFSSSLQQPTSYPQQNLSSSQQPGQQNLSYQQQNLSYTQPNLSYQPPVQQNLSYQQPVQLQYSQHSNQPLSPQQPLQSPKINQSLCSQGNIVSSGKVQPLPTLQITPSQSFHTSHISPIKSETQNLPIHPEQQFCKEQKQQISSQQNSQAIQVNPEIQQYIQQYIQEAIHTALSQFLPQASANAQKIPSLEDTQKIPAYHYSNKQPSTKRSAIAEMPTDYAVIRNQLKEKKDEYPISSPVTSIENSSGLPYIKSSETGMGKAKSLQETSQEVVNDKQKIAKESTENEQEVTQSYDPNNTTSIFSVTFGKKEDSDIEKTTLITAPVQNCASTHCEAVLEARATIKELAQEIQTWKNHLKKLYEARQQLSQIPKFEKIEEFQSPRKIINPNTLAPVASKKESIDYSSNIHSYTSAVEIMKKKIIGGDLNSQI